MGWNPVKDIEDAVTGAVQFVEDASDRANIPGMPKARDIGNFGRTIGHYVSDETDKAMGFEGSKAKKAREDQERAIAAAEAAEAERVKNARLSQVRAMQDDFSGREAGLLGSQSAAMNDPIRAAVRDRMRKTKADMQARGLLNSGVEVSAQGDIAAEGAAAMAKNRQAVSNALQATKKRLAEIYNEILYDKKVEAIETADMIYDQALKRSQSDAQTAGAFGNFIGSGLGAWAGSEKGE